MQVMANRSQASVYWKVQGQGYRWSQTTSLIRNFDTHVVSTFIATSNVVLFSPCSLGLTHPFGLSKHKASSFEVDPTHIFFSLSTLHIDQYFVVKQCIWDIFIGDLQYVRQSSRYWQKAMNNINSALVGVTFHSQMLRYLIHLYCPLREFAFVA